MKDNNDGGPAFAAVGCGEPKQHLQEGMTLLDYFAGQICVAIAAIEGNDKMLCAIGSLDDESELSDIERISRISYSLAQAMVDEKKRREVK